ncbi:hypothetical protein [Methylosinus sp. PW1]|uniref:hypothetical protein n=1 Tax=Methylosinus sp. PW1 TaxID=107636 RepID=UPI000A79D2A0|nr:hypothetical protein [Methylosinus sp. PW1]
MQIVEKLMQLPIVITLVGWALFYSWLFSMAGLGLSVTTCSISLSGRSWWSASP